MPFFRRDKTRKLITEVEVVRTKITLACTECQRRNYNKIGRASCRERVCVPV